MEPILWDNIEVYFSKITCFKITYSAFCFSALNKLGRCGQMSKRLIGNILHNDDRSEYDSNE